MPSNEYWAGFFDGEGSVTISSRGIVRANLTQNRRDVLDLAREQFGGIVSGPNRNGGHIWQVTSATGVRDFLNSIKEHAIVKRQEIDVALEAADLIRTDNLGCNPLTDAQVNHRMLLRERLLEIRNPHRHINQKSLDTRYRDKIKRIHNYVCFGCGANLIRESPVYQIIKEGHLYCRSCNGKLKDCDIKYYDVETLKQTIEESGSIQEAADKLHLSKASFYKKRKKYNLLVMFCLKCGKRFVPTPSLRKYCSDGCAVVGKRDKYEKRISKGNPNKAANARRYYERHKEELMARKRKYYLEHAEAIKARTREWYRRRKESAT